MLIVLQGVLEVLSTARVHDLHVPLARLPDAQLLKVDLEAILLFDASSH